ncbi:MAG: MliC family protein [Sphingomonadaceae bacterium]
MARTLLLALPLLAVVACGPTETSPEKAAADLARGAEARRVPLDQLEADPSVTATKSIGWECEGGLPITAIYGTGPGGEPDVALVIQGVDVRLAQTVSASGARYASDIGLQAGQGIVWWEKGDEATIAEYPEGTDSFETAEVKRTCKRK